MMPRLLFILCTLGGVLLPAATFAQTEDRGARLNPDKPPVIADDELRPIQLEITILDAPAAEAAQPALKDEQQIARLERLETEGKLIGVQRMKISLIANQPAQFQMGETAQITVGRTRAPGAPDPGGRGGFGSSFADVTRAQQIGTLIMATARPVAEGAVVELKLERSGLSTPKPPEGPDAPSEAPRTRQMTVNTTLLLREGETKIVSSSLQSKGDSREETWVLARAVVGPLNKPPGVAMISIFQLKNIAAKDAATMITTIFDRGGVRAIADVRTNTALVVSAAEADMKQIEAILSRLDENPGPPAALKLKKLEPIPEDASLFQPDAKPKTPVSIEPFRDPFLPAPQR